MRNRAYYVVGEARVACGSTLDINGARVQCAAGSGATALPLLCCGGARYNATLDHTMEFIVDTTSGNTASCGNLITALQYIITRVSGWPLCVLLT